MRRLIYFILITLLPLQAMALHGGLVFSGEQIDVAHELLHDGNASHYHDDDGSIYFSDSKESVNHLAEHAAHAHQPDMLTLMHWPETNLSGSGSVFALISVPVPDPHLDSPERPPQSAS